MTAYLESSAGGETIDEDAKYSREERWAARWSGPLCEGFCYAVWGS